MVKLVLLLLAIAWGDGVGPALQKATPVDPPKGYEKSIVTHRKKLERKFKDPRSSPLREDAREFQGNAYFPVDDQYRVEARIQKIVDVSPLLIPTSQPGRSTPFVPFAVLHMKVGEDSLQLHVYQQAKPASTEENKDWLFLPFTDETTGEETYGGGRYLDLKLPSGDTIVVDFNLAYNPYCAYSDGYACPIPPNENRLKVPIRAGVKDYRH